MLIMFNETCKYTKETLLSHSPKNIPKPDPYPCIRIRVGFFFLFSEVSAIDPGWFLAAAGIVELDPFMSM